MQVNVGERTPRPTKITSTTKFKYDKILQLNLSVKVPNENRNKNSTF